MLTSPMSKIKTSVFDAVLIKPDAFRRNTLSPVAVAIVPPSYPCVSCTSLISFALMRMSEPFNTPSL